MTSRAQSAPTRFLLVRHAAVDLGPPPGRLCGALDVPLSRHGREELAAQLPRWAARPAPDALYTSTLHRAREVARELGAVWQLTPRCDDRFREIDCGRLEGRRLDELAREYPDVWARNNAQIDDLFTWPGGESYRAFRSRILDGFAGAAARHPGGHVLVVTHAGVIAQLLGTLRGRPAAAWGPDRPDTLSVTEVTWADGGPASVLRFNGRV